MKEFYTVKEFCELVSISRTTLYRMIKSGRIDALKTTEGKNGRVIIPAAEIKKLKISNKPQDKPE